MQRSTISTIPQRIRSCWLTWSSLVVLCLTNGQIQAQAPKYVELTTGKNVYAGKIVARAGRSLWLIQRDGRLQELELTEITEFRKLSDQFVPYSAAQLRDVLRREYRDLEVVGTGSYLVVGPNAVVRNYAHVFEDQYRAVRAYFSVRGFDLPEPEFPLVAIVFPDATSFARNAASDGFRVVPGLRGYYIATSNRISLFHQNPVRSSQNHPSLNSRSITEDARNEIDTRGEWSKRSATQRFFPAERIDHRFEIRPDLITIGGIDAVFRTETFDDNAMNPARIKEIVESPSDSTARTWASTEGDLESTMIHEATHQVAFNIGIHNRLGNANPRWLVEGLATAFEAPGMRSTSLQKVPGAKLNLSRLSRFREFVKLRRQPKSLEDFVRNGNLDGMDILDGYAQSWALTYFLIETRPREYARYVKLITARPLLNEYTDANRIADFREAFGDDLVLLDAKFLRFIDQVR